LVGAALATFGVTHKLPVLNHASPVLSGFGAHSDIGLPTGLGQTPTVNFGPGDPAMAHQLNERVTIESLVACTRAIALTIVEWCG